MLDTENYVRRNGGSRWLGIVEPSSEKLCPCLQCLDEETQKWIKALKYGKEFNWSDNDLLLPPRLSGYSLGRKEWCQFSLDFISVAENPWPDLSMRQELATGNRNTIKGLILPEGLGEHEQQDIYNMVANHSQVMARPPEKRVGDVICGKGESLILLFHGRCREQVFVVVVLTCSILGNSGTGKTLYAEWLAKFSQRPLFKVGTSELGLDAAVAERNLKEIFELAETWGAVLLM